MKKLISLSCFLSIFLFSMGCKNYCFQKTPDVLHPVYSMYNISGEKGYLVKFELSHEAQPTAVIINKIKQNIPPKNKNGLKYSINVISETRKIENYKIEGTRQDNGIIFQIKNKEIFKPVEFKLE